MHFINYTGSPLSRYSAVPTYPVVYKIETRLIKIKLLLWLNMLANIQWFVFKWTQVIRSKILSGNITSK